MKSVNKLSLENATALSKTEMKMVVGGSSDGICPPYDEDVGIVLLPVPGHCHNYIECNHTGKWQLRECPGALHFSPTQLVCMYPPDAGCK